MRAFSWPLIGAVAVPGVTAILLAITNTAILPLVGAQNWLLLAACGALAGFVHFIKARLFGDHAPEPPGGVKALYRAVDRGDDQAATKLIAAEEGWVAALRVRAAKNRSAARQYRRYLEAELEANATVLRLPDVDAADRACFERERERLRHELTWAEEREGTLGRWFA
jgi:hypothetical protein